MRAEAGVKIVWAPQPGPQTAALVCPAFDILYGGARGGGKSDLILGDWGYHVNENESPVRGAVFRKTSPQLDELIYRSKQIYEPLGWEWKAALSERKWVSGRGDELLFRHLENESDSEKYQGFGLSRIYVDEAGNFPSPDPINKLKGSLRSGRGAKSKFLITANPGGPGHHWLKKNYVDPSPLGMKIFDDGAGNSRVFIPSKVTDNKILMDNDPTYINRLRAAGSPELVKAWLDGDWNVVQGAYFPEFSIEKHVVAPHQIPPHWLKFMSFDWGSASPFAVGWFAVADGEEYGYPKGAVVMYREWYGGDNNVGIKMNPKDISSRILRSEKEKIHYRVADPSIFKTDAGPSIAEKFAESGVLFRRADNRRIPGWSEVRSRLGGVNQTPMLYIFSTCVNMIRTIPIMQHCPYEPEDLDTESDDHMADILRYALFSRPYVRKDDRIKNVNLKSISSLTFDEIHALDEHNRSAEQWPQRI